MNLIFKNPVTFKKITFDYKLLLFSYFPQEQKVQYIKKLAFKYFNRSVLCYVTVMYSIFITF